jgi:eukaryotic-like serine/threonine-protein kinase
MRPSEPTPSRDRVGGLVAGRYRLGPLLGSGGMASVYRAADESLGRTVAVKLFHAALTNAGDERRQAEEVTLLASLNHPALVTLFDAGRDPDGAFLVMEYVEGADLRTRLDSGPLAAQAVARIGADIASALAHIHARGVVHRDIKPANILLPMQTDSPGAPHAKLADFGIARLIDSTRLTATGTLIGTASFLSPEQARGIAVAEPSDVYSLGLVLLEALSGQRAFPGTAVESTVARLSRDPQIPGALGPGWTALLREATAREPAHRPRAEELAVRLHALAAETSTRVLPLDGSPFPGNAPTERLVPAASPTEPETAAESPTEPLDAGDAPTVHLRPRRAPRWMTKPLVILASAAALAAVIVAVIVGIPTTGADPGTDATVQYPAVDGDLGAHLAELQRSVEP